MALPEKWKTRDGRVLLIREMSDDHIKNTLAMLRQKGKVSLRDWRDARPELPTGLQGEFAQDAADESFSQEWEAWLRMRPSGAIDAFHLEMAYRRRHGITIVEKDARPAMGELVDPAPETMAARADALEAERTGVEAELAGVQRWKPNPYRDPKTGDQVAEDKNADWDDLWVVTGLERGKESDVVLGVVLHHKSTMDKDPTPGALVDIADFRQRYYLLAS
jgi:hypothetical protein